MINEEKPKRRLMQSRHPKVPGNDTVSLYCDECGELPPCAHRDERGRPAGTQEADR